MNQHISAATNSVRDVWTLRGVLVNSHVITTWDENPKSRKWLFTKIFLTKWDHEGKMSRVFLFPAGFMAAFHLTITSYCPLAQYVLIKSLMSQEMCREEGGREEASKLNDLKMFKARHWWAAHTGFSSSLRMTTVRFIIELRFYNVKTLTPTVTWRLMCKIFNITLKQ